MTQKKDLEKPEAGEEPKFIDKDYLESFIEHIDEFAGTVFENPDEAVAYLRDFFTRNFGQNLPTRKEWYRREREAKEAKLRQQEAMLKK
ncbi:MAG: hypothetical protein G01um101438_226 [Parcubacteria group bacterium Gr01-1014_38]|nr:MAG: hypothetical protein G01um101438_226 [Parcubacteria group bacterium Gr01-1014_38]